MVLLSPVLNHRTKDIEDAQERLQQMEGALTLNSSWSDSPLRRTLHFRLKWRVDRFLPGVEQAELYLSSGFHLKGLELLIANV